MCFLFFFILLVMYFDEMKMISTDANNDMNLNIRFTSFTVLYRLHRTLDAT